MGRFTYDSSVSADFDDRELAHLQAVIVAKIRRGERFTFTWKIDISLGGGRTSVYLYPESSWRLDTRVATHRSSTRPGC